MIWGAELERELAGLGELRRYADGACLSHGMHKPPIIRRIISGHVDIFAHTAGGKAHVCRCSDGEIIGVHSNLHQGELPGICWKAAGDIECLEIPWREVASRSKANTRLASIMQHICQIRQYGIALAIHPVFSCLDIHERAMLFKNATIRMLRPDEQLISKQDERAHLYLIVSGKVRIQSENQSPSLCAAGDILGEISLFGFSPVPTADAVAESFSEIIEFRDSDMLNIMQENTEFRLRITELSDSRTTG